MWIFLDDKRESPMVVHNNHRGLGVEFGKSQNWVYARNYEEFVNLVSTNFDQIDMISFDHDIYSWDYIEKDGILVPIEKTGKDAAQYVIDFCIDNDKILPNWFVHSDNTGGNKNIRTLLLNYMFRVEGRVKNMEDSFGWVDGRLFYTI